MAHEDVLVGFNQLWKIWSIQGFVILSLTMQLFLALMAPLRKKTSSSAVISIVWLAYFLANWTAIFALGLISKAGCNNSPSDLDSSKNLLALWASFLLIHLGGPDTITAFALEDNSLWIRYLVGLIAKVFVFLYIFIKMLPNKTLVAPTLLVFATGIIKYGERVRAFYLANLKTFKVSSSVIKKTGIHVPLAELLAHHGGLPDHRTREMGLLLFQIFKGLIVDIVPNHSELLKSRAFFLNNDAGLAFEIIAIELNLLYEVFYTKIRAAYSSWGFFIRNIAYFMSIAALILFCSIKKDGLKPTDVHITYALLAGVITHDMTSEVMLAESNWRLKRRPNLTMQIVCRCIIPFLITMLMYTVVIYLLYVCGCKSIIERSWSSKMGSFNLLAYSFEEGRRIKIFMSSRCCHAIFGYIHKKAGVELPYIKEEIDKMRYTKKINMDDGIWKYTFNILHERASGADADEPDQMKEIYETRGELALRDTSKELKWYVTGFEYNRSVLLWHVATEICYNTDTNLNKECENIKFGKILSDYMIYLMVNQPDMMSPVSDIFPERYHDTCCELKGLEQKVRAETLNEFCFKVLEAYSGCIEPDHHGGNAGASVLTDCCKLVRILECSERKWEIICKVWVELLLYAAGHCRADSHARLVSKGGEFVTFVWLLMAHFGIGPHFPKNLWVK